MHLEDIRNNVDVSEKNRLENIARTEETENIINELDTAIKSIEKKGGRKFIGINKHKVFHYSG